MATACGSAPLSSAQLSSASRAYARGRGGSEGRQLLRWLAGVQAEGGRVEPRTSLPFPSAWASKTSRGSRRVPACVAGEQSRVGSGRSQAVVVVSVVGRRRRGSPARRKTEREAGRIEVESESERTGLGARPCLFVSPVAKSSRGQSRATQKKKRAGAGKRSVECSASGAVKCPRRAGWLFCRRCRP